MNVVLAILTALSLAAITLILLRIRMRRAIAAAPPIESYVGGTSLLASARHDDLDRRWPPAPPPSDYESDQVSLR